jgi:DNA helicase-2/ATP-dependent DNA helicase PcrA
MLSEIDTLDERADRISLLTLHASKGLEFKCVFIAGLEQGVIPFYRAQESEELEEEKRLLYVGMTRARRRLFLTHAAKRKWFGSYKKSTPSPFLKKIKNDLVKFSKPEKVFHAQEKPRKLDLF